MSPSGSPEDGGDSVFDWDDYEVDDDSDCAEEVIAQADSDVSMEEFVEEMDIESESYARAHRDGWFYDDDDREECGDDLDADWQDQSDDSEWEDDE